MSNIKAIDLANGVNLGYQQDLNTKLLPLETELFLFNEAL